MKKIEGAGRQQINKSNNGIKAIVLVLLVVFIGLFSGKGAASEKFDNYAMDNHYFTCEIPASWALQRDEESDAEYAIYEIQLLGPTDDKATTSIFVSYYAKDNADFNDHEDFIRSNTRNVAGETKNKYEHYKPAKKIKLNGRDGFVLERERELSLHPKSKSDETIRIKEKLYVVPAKEGFYVLHYSASIFMFDAQLPVFDRVVGTFRMGGENGSP